MEEIKGVTKSRFRRQKEIQEGVGVDGVLIRGREMKGKRSVENKQESVEKEVWTKVWKRLMNRKQVEEKCKQSGKKNVVLKRKVKIIRSL